MTAAASNSPSAADASWFQWSWQRRDRHPVATGLSVAAVSAAVAMATFGLPPIDLHGLLHGFGIMDPLCGGTRAARYTARGEWALAWRYNPLGILVVLAAAAAAVRAVVGVVTRQWVTITVAWTPRRRRVVTVAAVVVLGALTVRQQLRAELLIAGT